MIYNNNEVSQSFSQAAEIFMEELRKLPHKDIVIGMGGGSGWSTKWHITRLPKDKKKHENQS